MESTTSERKMHHAVKLLNSLVKMKSEKFVCDFQIRVGPSFISVHRAVLATFSKYFRVMLQKESDKEYANMNDLTFDAARTCVEFMYTGEAEILLSEISSVVKASRLMELGDLTEICLQHLRDNLCGENSLLASRVFRTYGSKNDVRQAEDCVIENFGTVMQTDDFVFVDCKDLRRYVSKANIAPDILWTGVVRWLKENSCEREQSLIEIVGEVLKNDGITMEFVIQVVWKHPFVQEDDAAKSIVLDVIADIATEECLNLESSFEIKNILTSNCIANGNRIESMVNKCLATNFTKAIEFEDIYFLSFEDLTTILQSEHLTCGDEMIKWKAILNWVKKDQTREENLPDLMQLINFKMMPMSDISNIRSEGLVRQSTACMDIILSGFLSGNMKESQEQAFAAQYINKDPSTMLVMDTISGVISALDVVEKKQTEVTKVEKERFCGLVSAEGKLYVFQDDAIFQYSPSGIWKKLLTWSMEHTASSQIVVFRDKIYSIGKTIVCCYDPSHNVFKQPYNGCGLEKGFFVAASSRTIFALGGDGTWKDARCLDPMAKKWIILAPMNSRRTRASAAVYREKLYVMGGVPFIGGTLRSTECYDPSENSWTTLQNMERPREWSSAIVYNDKLYAVGGARSFRQAKNSVEVCDADTNQWSIVCDLTTQGGRMMTCVWNGVDIESLVPKKRTNLKK